MGLGPAVCENCQLIAEYHPNTENPNKQGDWLCPNCNHECTGNLFEFNLDTQSLITIRSQIFKENMERDVS